MGGGGGDAGRFPLETWFWEMPICTRWWTTATVLMSGMVQCQLITPFQLFYSYRAVFVKSQVRALPSVHPTIHTCSFRERNGSLTRRLFLFSTGDSSPRSSTLGPSPSTFSSTSTSCNDIRDYSKSPQVDHRHTSHGCYSTPWRSF